MVEKELPVSDLVAFGIIPRMRCSTCANYKTPRIDGNIEVGVCGVWGNPVYSNGHCQKWQEAK